MIPSRPRVYLPLRHMIAQEMPALDLAMGPLRLDQIRLVFNAMTDLDIQPGEPVDLSTQSVYADFVGMYLDGTLDAAVQNGLWFIRKLLAPPAGPNARVLVSRNQREGGYCGKDAGGNHFRAGKDSFYGHTLRQWKKWQA